VLIPSSSEWQCRIERDIAWPDLERLQTECLASVRSDPHQVYLLCSEPKPTFTSGVSARVEDVLWSPEEQKRRGVALHATARGGQWTYHGPGQIVLFPILNLDGFGYDRRAIHRFMGDLRIWLADYLKSLNVVTDLRDRPFGLYADQKKLVSFGMAIQRGISSQGLALYHSEQSKFFQGIHPCGVSSGLVTSLSELGVALSWETVAFQMIETVKKGLKTRKNSLGCYSISTFHKGETS
jgi:lipoyl(octanoyl) transferase